MDRSSWLPMTSIPSDYNQSIVDSAGLPEYKGNHATQWSESSTVQSCPSLLLPPPYNPPPNAPLDSIPLPPPKTNSTDGFKPLNRKARRRLRQHPYGKDSSTSADDRETDDMTAQERAIYEHSMALRMQQVIWEQGLDPHDITVRTRLWMVLNAYGKEQVRIYRNRMAYKEEVEDVNRVRFFGLPNVLRQSYVPLAATSVAYQDPSYK